jgi:hypothetical protein
MSDTLRYEGRRLLQIGVALFLFASFEGFAVPHFAVPNLGRSVHALSAFVGVLFVAMGLVWPTLELGARAARTAFWLLIYSAFATIAAFLIAGVWGAGGSIIPLASVAYVGAICRRPWSNASCIRPRRPGLSRLRSFSGDFAAMKIAHGRRSRTDGCYSNILLWTFLRYRDRRQRERIPPWPTRQIPRMSLSGRRSHGRSRCLPGSRSTR